MKVGLNFYRLPHTSVLGNLSESPDDNIKQELLLEALPQSVCLLGCPGPKSDTFAESVAV